MFDTIERRTSRFLVFAVAVTFVISLLPFPRLANVNVASVSDSTSKPNPIQRAAPAATPSAGAGMTLQSVTYDMCLQDDSNGSTLSLNTTTGDYIFTCGNCVKKTGTG